jgi:hypothetical protein
MTVSFEFNATSLLNLVVWIFDGDGTNGTLLAQLSGEIKPSPFTATS